MSTIYQRFQEVAASHPTSVFVADIQQGTIHSYTYGQILDLVGRVSGYMSSVGSEAGDRVALLLPNSSDWVIADLACAQLGLIVVPIHTTYNWNYIKYTIEHSGATTLIVDDKKWQEHKSAILGLGLKNIIVRGEMIVPEGCVLWKSCLEYQDSTTQTHANADDVHTIVYTSGTTADPKGVRLTHTNILFDTDAARQYIPIYAGDSFFSFLPLSHMLERTGSYYTAMSVGASVYFASSNDKISEEVVIVKPTIMLSVPRMFDKMYEKIFDTVDAGPAWKKKLFFAALRGKKNSSQLMQFVYELLVFRTIKAKLGGRLRFVVSGGASLDRKTAKFFQTIGLQILEGYGLTETSPIVAVNPVGKSQIGTVGLPLPGVEVTIDKDKQILIRGKNVMRGYYDNPEATSEVLDPEGWFHSGDMGFIDQSGYLTVIGRVKELIVLSNGKKVNPIPLEISLNRSRYISQCMVYGNGQSHLSAIVVPDFKELNLWLESEHLVQTGREALVLPQVIDLFQSEISNSLKEYSAIEQVRDFKLVPDEFTQENDMLTPTQKLKRMKILSIYKVE